MSHIAKPSQGVADARPLSDSAYIVARNILSVCTTRYEPDEQEVLLPPIAECVTKEYGERVHLLAQADLSAWRNAIEEADRYVGDAIQSLDSGGADAGGTVPVSSEDVPDVPTIDNPYASGSQTIESIPGTSGTPADAVSPSVPGSMASAYSEVKTGSGSAATSGEALSSKGFAVSGPEESESGRVPDVPKGCTSGTSGQVKSEVPDVPEQHSLGTSIQTESDDEDVPEVHPLGTSGTRVAMPDASSLVGACVQFWPDGSGWSAKIECYDTEERAKDGAPRIFYAGFGREAHKRRYQINQKAKDGRVSDEFAALFDEASRHLEPGQYISIVTKEKHDKATQYQNGRSTAEKHYCHQYAVLTLSPDKKAPAAIDLYLSGDEDDEPVSVQKIDAAREITKSGKRRREKASEWIGYYDPDNVLISARQELDAAVAKRQRNGKAAKLDPRNWVGALIAEALAPYEDRLCALENENRVLREENASLIERVRKSDIDTRDLEKENRLLTGRVAALERHVDQMEEDAEGPFGARH